MQTRPLTGRAEARRSFGAPPTPSHTPPTAFPNLFSPSLITAPSCGPALLILDPDASGCKKAPEIPSIRPLAWTESADYDRTLCGHIGSSGPRRQRSRHSKGSTGDESSRAETIGRVHPPTGIGRSLVVNETARVDVAAAPTSAAREDGPRPEIWFRRRRSLPAALRELWGYGELMISLAERDLRMRYKQAALGIAWAVITPLLLMLAFSLVFTKFARVDTHGAPYPLFSYLGLIPWSFFAAALSQAAQA